LDRVCEVNLKVGDAFHQDRDNLCFAFILEEIVIGGRDTDADVIIGELGEGDGSNVREISSTGGFIKDLSSRSLLSHKKIDGTIGDQKVTALGATTTIELDDLIGKLKQLARANCFLHGAIVIIVDVVCRE
jgi:hypothetical protein